MFIMSIIVHAFCPILTLSDTLSFSSYLCFLMMQVILLVVLSSSRIPSPRKIHKNWFILKPLHKLPLPDFSWAVVSRRTMVDCSHSSPKRSDLRSSDQECPPDCSGAGSRCPDAGYPLPLPGVLPEPSCGCSNS